MILPVSYTTPAIDFAFLSNETCELQSEKSIVLVVYLTNK